VTPGAEPPAIVVGMQAAALCLDYPDAAWAPSRELLARAVDALPAAPAAELAAFLDWVAGAGPGVAARSYVETFDLRLRCCPYLTYYSFGDTRKRGMALLRFSHAYRSAGFEIASGELPDHLAVLCEFTARDPRAGRRLFAEHRAGLELLHLALGDTASPYARVTGIIRALLPEPDVRDLQRALDLARSGPPAEEVGLEPFAPPEHLGARR
jgi:nitrate reductase delta subunit